MLAQSTGLGESILKASIKDLKPAGELLILHLEATKPEGWHLRAGMQTKNVFPLLRA